PLALSDVALANGEGQGVPAQDVLDAYALALPAARRQKGLAIVYDTLGRDPTSAVWDGDAVHQAAKQLGIAEAQLFDYLKSGKWVGRRQRPEMIAGSWNRAQTMLAFDPERRKQAESLIDEAKKLYKENNFGVQLGTKPLVVGKRMFAPEQVLMT